LVGKIAKVFHELARASRVSGGGGGPAQ